MFKVNNDILTLNFDIVVYITQYIITHLSPKSNNMYTMVTCMC